MTETTRAHVVVASTRAASGQRPDETGPILLEFLASLGYEAEVGVVVDGHPVGVAIAAAVEAGCRLVLTTGGTGLTPSDLTPEMTLSLIERPVPGIAEAIRAAGVAKGVPTAMLSRGVAGLIGDCLVVNLPGSKGGVQDAIEVLGPVLQHAVEQTRGSDH